MTDAVADAAALRIARDTVQLDVGTRHDDLRDVLATLQPQTDAQTIDTIAQMPDADLTALFADVYARGNSGSEGLNFDERRTLLVQLGGRLDIAQLSRVNLLLTQDDVAALADVVGALQPGLGCEFAHAQAQQTGKREARGITGDDSRLESHAEEYEQPPGGVPAPRTPSASADDRTLRDELLAVRHASEDAAWVAQRGVEFVKSGVTLPLQFIAGVPSTVQQMPLVASDALGWADHTANDMADKLAQVPGLIGPLLRGQAPSPLQTRVPTFQPESQLGQQMHNPPPGMTSLEVALRRTPAGLGYAPGDLCATLRDGDATDIAETLGALTMGGVLLEAGLTPVRQFGAATLDAVAPAFTRTKEWALAGSTPELKAPTTAPQTSALHLDAAPGWLTGERGADRFDVGTFPDPDQFALAGRPFLINSSLPPGGIGGGGGGRPTITAPNGKIYADLRAHSNLYISVSDKHVTLGNYDEWAAAYVASKNGTYAGPQLLPHYVDIRLDTRMSTYEWSTNAFCTDPALYATGVNAETLVHNAMFLLKDRNGGYPLHMAVQLPARVEFSPSVFNLATYTRDAGRPADVARVLAGRHGVLGTNYFDVEDRMKTGLTLPQAVLQSRFGQVQVAPYYTLNTDSFALRRDRFIEGSLTRRP
jgi:hypothetical protein